MNLSENGLPTGSQLVAGLGEEDQLLQLAAQVEQAGLFTPLNLA
jgi:Asp-tRNA(Asn)/Glu-tRNA(Gln) amidotransferase A subunit family amidase